MLYPQAVTKVYAYRSHLVHFFPKVIIILIACIFFKEKYLYLQEPWIMLTFNIGIGSTSLFMSIFW